MSVLPVTRARATSIAGAALALVVLAYFARQWWLDLLVAGLQDARVYLQAGRDVLSGHDVYSPRAALPYTYPPLWALICAPLAALPDGLALLAFSLTGAALCWWLLARVRPHGRHVWIWVGLAALSAPIGRSLYLGQVNPFLVALVVADAVALPVLLRGAGTGLAAAVKVTPAFLALPFLVGRDWRSLGRTVACFAAVTSLAWLVLPEASRHYWTGLLWESSRVGNLDYPDNQSWLGFCLRMWGTETVPWVSRVGIVAILVLCWRAVAVQQRNGSTLAALTAAGTGAALVSPVSWSHHWVWLVIISAMVWRRGAKTWATVLLVPLVAAPLWVADEVLPHLSLPGPVVAVLTSLPALTGLVCLVVMARWPLTGPPPPDFAALAAGPQVRSPAQPPFVRDADSRSAR